MLKMDQQNRFDDFLKLDVITIMDFYSIKDMKKLLKFEPYNSDTLIILNKLLSDFCEEEEYAWCQMILDEINRREELTII